MEILVAELISVVCLGLGSFLVGFLPICLKNRVLQQRWPLLTSGLLCFGGGVLLATAIVHILPEVRETMPQYKQYSEIIFCCGFFLLYVIDEIMHLFYENGHEDHFPNMNGQPFDSDQAFSRRFSHLGNEKSYESTERSPLVQQPPYNPALLPKKSKSDSQLFLDGECPPSQVYHVGHQEPCNYGPIVNIGLLLALCVHAILEGLVIGLEREATKVLLLLGAVASHKIVVSFCLGMELSSNPGNSALKNFMSIAVFAMGSVIGILIGVFLSKLPKEVTQLPIPILQAIAGGTLLYVTLSEVIPRERARWHKKHQNKAVGLIQLICIAIGFCSMTIVSIKLG